MSIALLQIPTAFWFHVVTTGTSKKPSPFLSVHINSTSPKGTLFRVPTDEISPQESSSILLAEEIGIILGIQEELVPKGYNQTPMSYLFVAVVVTFANRFILIVSPGNRQVSPSTAVYEALATLTSFAVQLYAIGFKGQISPAVYTELETGIFAVFPLLTAINNVRCSKSSILIVSPSLTISLVISSTPVNKSFLSSTYTTFVFSSTLGNVKSYSKVPSTISVVISYAIFDTALVASISSCVKVISVIVNLEGFSGNLVKITLTLLFCGDIYVLPNSTTSYVVAESPLITHTGIDSISLIIFSGSTTGFSTTSFSIRGSCIIGSSIGISSTRGSSTTGGISSSGKTTSSCGKDFSGIISSFISAAFSCETSSITCPITIDWGKKV